MLQTFFSVVLCVQTLLLPDSTDLFRRLDQNGDGLIRSDEVAESRQVFFRRALRVGDSNEDGALNAQELARATSTPKPNPVPAVQGIAGLNANRNPQQLDRNRDGQISLDEIPAPLKPRFAQFLAQRGQQSVPVATIRMFLQGAVPQQSPGTPDGKAAGNPLEKQSSDRDLNQAGAGPQMLVPERMQDVNSAKGPQRDSDPDTMFSRLDENGDDRLAGDEIPQRMRNAVSQVDQNGDGGVDRREFARALLRRLQNATKSNREPEPVQRKSANGT